MLTCPDFSSCKIIVIGDSMLDRYWHGDTSRISPEAPVPVVKIERHEERVGGAANVAVNVQALGADTSLISVIGEDDAGRTLQSLLQEKGVICDFIKSPILNTTLKLRVLGRHQQLIRLDFEDKHAWPASDILEKLQHAIKGANVVILSDYAKGVLAHPQTLIEFARQHGVKILVDPKNADLNVYRGASLLTPNLSEFEAAVGPCETETVIEEKGLALVEKLGLEALLVTRGSQGMTLIQADGSITHIPAQAREVFDITGAGDTVIAMLGACLAAGTPFLHAAKLANLAAGLAVGRLGTAMITREEMQNLLSDHSFFGRQGILSAESLMVEVAQRKARGHKIVFTNGCFDILHAGHVAYLQQARLLGDCLIIGVNDDQSVNRLKGPTRPINSLQQRMQVLAALGCVDYVVPFGEDTPEHLITEITPHVLVKGGDYKIQDIVGAAHVQRHGGKVKVLPFVEGCSTTNIVEKVVTTQQHYEPVAALVGEVE